MLDQERFRNIHLLLLLTWLTAGALIFVGVKQREGPLEDPNTITLLDYGLSKGYIQITQARPGEPLTITSFNNNPSPQEFMNDPNTKVVFNEEQWRRVGKLVKQFVVLANWGLGDPFLYGRREDGVVYVRAFHAADFTYQNPFDNPVSEPFETNITASSVVDARRRGWRVIGRNMVLFLSETATQEEVRINLGDASSQGVCLIGKKFLLTSPEGKALRLSAGSSAVAEDKTERLQLETLNQRGETISQQRAKSSEYFTWSGENFTVYDTATAPVNRGDNSSSKLPAGYHPAENLVFTKNVNGRPTRVHILGEVTTNLIGARLGGYTPYLDGAIKTSTASTVALTLDPELQAGAFFLLRNALLNLDGVHYLGRPRRGSVTILDLDTGGIVAQAGYPSFEPDWSDNRRVLIDRAAIARNPAAEVHMSGSTIKVLTVAMGYLLFGNAQADLLPTSINSLAVKQAFQDTYGVELTAPLEGEKALVTEDARRQFEQLGGASRVKPECLDVLRRVFLVSPDKNDVKQREQIVSPEFSRFFDMDKLAVEFFPEQSRLPVLNADSMERFRHYALGTEDTRFTTLRLAAMLGTASSGKVIRPFIVESVLDRSDKLWTPRAGAFSDIDLRSGSEPQFRTARMLEITKALRRVLLPGGTGFFFTDKDVQQFLGTDNPNTSGINEAQLRSADYGKSGTADYGEPDSFEDSLFVYRHGQYVLAVWLEHADRGEVSDPGHRPFERHPAHKLTDQLTRLIESLEK